MRRSWGLGTALTLCLAFGGSSVAAQPSPFPWESEQTGLTRAEAVALVLAEDPRFTDLPDFEVQSRLAMSKFASYELLGSDYYRVLPTVASAFTPWMYDFGYSANWLIEVTLVADCTEPSTQDGPSSETAPWPDPCAWRHSWFYRVQPDGTASLLFEEGVPAPMPPPAQ